MAAHSYSKEAMARSHRKFEKERTKQIGIRLNDRTDADIIAFLDKLDNKRAFILAAIRSAMAAEQNKKDPE